MLLYVIKYFSSGPVLCFVVWCSLLLLPALDHVGNPKLVGRTVSYSRELEHMIELVHTMLQLEKRKEQEKRKEKRTRKEKRKKEKKKKKVKEKKRKTKEKRRRRRKKEERERLALGLNAEKVFFFLKK